MQLLSYVRCFIGFTFAFEIDHVQQGGERMEIGGHSDSFGGARPTNAPPWRRPCLQVFEEDSYLKSTHHKYNAVPGEILSKFMLSKLTPNI